MASHRVSKLIETGARAPDFELRTLDGPIVSLSGLLAEGPVLLAFFKVTCPICQLTLPYLDRIHAAGPLRVYSISQNDPEDTREFNREFRLHLPTLLDTEESGYPVSNEYGISSVPTLFQVERDGTISRVIEGWRKREIVGFGAQVPDALPEWKAA